MSLAGFGNGAFNNSKVATAKVISDTPGNAQELVKWGNSSKANIGLKSNTKAAVNPTTMPGGEYGMSNAGGSSGDGPTPGFDGRGFGIASLDGAQGNESDRGLAY